MSRVFITGITGFVGSHMADYILEHTDDHIYGFKRWMEDTTNIDHIIDNPRVTMYGGDLMDYASNDRAIKLSNPDILMNEDFNLEAVGDAAKGWTSYLKYPVIKGLLAKLGPKAATRAFGGPAGWTMGAADIIDYFGYPIYDHIPGGDYLTWRDTSEGEEE